MEQFFDNLAAECGYYISLLKQCPKDYFLYRGFNKEIPFYEKINHHLKDRKPRNTPIHIHDHINSSYEKQFGWKIRNGVFCFGYTLSGRPLDLGYGMQYLLFPIGEFDFVYSPQHFDLYEYVSSNIGRDLSKIIFKNDSLISAIESGEKEDGLSNEISLKVNTYYLVNLRHREQLATKIWG